MVGAGRRRHRWCGRSPTAREIAVAARRPAASAASAGRPTARASCSRGERRHDPPRADAGRTPARRSSTRSPRTCRAQTLVVPSTGGTPDDRCGARRRSADAAGSTRGTSWSIARRRTSSGARSRSSTSPAATPKTLHEDVDDKFWSIPGEPAPARSRRPTASGSRSSATATAGITSMSMPAAGGDAGADHERASSKRGGRSGRPTARASRSTRTSRNNHGDRHLGVATIGGDPAQRDGRADHQRPRHEHRAAVVARRHAARLSAHRSAELRGPVCGRRDKPARRRLRLTDSMPAAIDRSAFVEPELVHYAGPDGQQVPAWLFVPKNLDRTKKHPAIVWIHGDGVNQNYDGWHVQRNYAVYYSFHQYLLQQGYVVIAPDYRGSIGYGKAWREGVYMDVGGKDAKDAWMAANYLKTLPYVDMRSGRRLGTELRRLLHADRRHRSADAVSAPRSTSPASPTTRCTTRIRITAAGRRAASARRSRTRRSTRRRRRCRTSIGSRGRCWCCTARPTSTCRTCTRCGSSTSC